MNSSRLSWINLNTTFIYKKIIAPLSLIITTFVIYFPSLKYPFQFDDSANIIKFYNIRHLTFSELFFSSSRWVIFWLNTLNYKLAQFDPFVYRFFNLCFHLIAGLLIYFLLSSLLSKFKNKFFEKNSFYISLLTAAMFLLHPVQTQTVSYVIQGQLEGLATLFVLSIVSLFVFATRQHGLIKTFSYSMIFLLAFLSSGTKEIAIVSPFLVLLIDWFFIAQGEWKQFKKRIFFHISLFIFVFGLYAYLMKPQFFLNIFGFKVEAKNNIGNLLNSNYQQPITAWQFFISQFKVILHYFAIFIWPFSLCADYDWHLVNSISDIDCFLPFFAVLAIVLFNFYLLKKNKTNLIAFGLLWFLICLAPRSSIVPSSEIMADYKTYLASLGFLFILASLIIFLASKTKYLTHIIIFALIALSFGTIRRNYVWSSGYEFWKDIVEKSPTKARAFNNLGNELVRQNRYKEAIFYFKRAIKLEGKDYSDPHVNLGNCYGLLGKFDSAIESFKRSLIVNKYQPDAYNSLGLALMQQNNFEAAEQSFLACLMLVPHYGKALLNLSRTYIQLNDYDRAWTCLNRAVKKSDVDNSVLAWEPFAELSIKMEKYEDAILGFQKLYQLESNPDNLFKIGVAFYMNKDFENALKIFEQSHKIEPFDNRILCDLVECNIKLHNAEGAMKYINYCKQNRIIYPGMDVHEAQLYYFAGNYDLAKNIINNFLNKDGQTEESRRVAYEILDAIG
ncbi:hypothetical protein A3F66_06055 [candidate division TM6 bacterium RIFCSPHIGHO2_12_FULL_32_22]|nr:MAG: hypothetical protein A3F66_06055 [candidate division TM6 bacterium RIFCSPHIGHO2_12_FULL_32_22]